MAQATECQTPGAVFTTRVNGHGVDVSVSFPRHVELTEEHAKMLEANLHNALELALAPLFVVEQ